MKNENKYIALNIANSYMLSKVCSKDDFIEEYMELYFKVINSNGQFINNKLTDEDVYYLAINVANTYMTGEISDKDDFIEEYMNVYLQVVSYNDFLFNEKEVTEEIIRNLSMNIANTYMMGKIGSKNDIIEEYMEFYNKAISYNKNRLQGMNFDKNLEFDFSKRSR